MRAHKAIYVKYNDEKEDSGRKRKYEVTPSRHTKIDSKRETISYKNYITFQPP